MTGPALAGWRMLASLEPRAGWGLDESPVACAQPCATRARRIAETNHSGGNLDK
jgi:hypothetical protein